eukprot:381763-Prymnesium_polylepis.1
MAVLLSQLGLGSGKRQPSASGGSHGRAAVVVAREGCRARTLELKLPPATATTTVGCHRAVELTQ